MTISIVDSKKTIGISNVGTQGLAGPPGPPGSAGASYLQLEAGENLGGQRAVIVSAGTAVYADNTNLNHANKAVGITAAAFNTGVTGNVQSGGELTGLSGLTAGMPIYLSTSGTLTQTTPTGGFIQQLGIAVSATSMLIEIQPSIVTG
ncbi:MAG: hypothetical protein PHT48_09590 [Dechloromonas sp.]|nr:hypothetical protein [Dechloromonas sp.]